MHYRKPLVEKHTKQNSLYDRFSLVFRSVQKFTIKYPLKMARRAHCSMPTIRLYRMYHTIRILQMRDLIFNLRSFDLVTAIVNFF